MWKVINVKSQDYLINFEFGSEPSALKVFVSNFIHLWFTEFDGKQLLKTFKEYNKLIEFDLATLKKEMESMILGKRNNVFWDIRIADTSLKLKFKSTLACVLIRFDIDFPSTSDHMWFQSVVLPSWILISGMRKEIEDLCDGMKRKDEEITEYKLEGAVLSRKTVVTPAFDDSARRQTRSETLKIMSSKETISHVNIDLTEDLDEVNRHLNCRKLALKKEPENSSRESETFNLSEPPVKKFIQSDSITVDDSESKYVVSGSKPGSQMKNSDMPKLEKPIVKKKPKVTRRLHNL